MDRFFGGVCFSFVAHQPENPFTGPVAHGPVVLLFPKPIQERIESSWKIQVRAWGTFKNGEIAYASNERFYMWFSGLRMSLDYPLGIGQGNLGEIYPKYKMPASWEPNPPHLHNNFLQILVQNGWIGFAAYLFWIFAYFWGALRFELQNQDSQYLNWVFLCVFSAVLVWGLTEYTFSHQFMNVQFFLLGLQACLWKWNPKEPL